MVESLEIENPHDRVWSQKYRVLMRRIYCFGQDLTVTDLDIKEKLDKVNSTKLVQFHAKEKIIHIITKITDEQYCLHEQKQN